MVKYSSESSQHWSLGDDGLGVWDRRVDGVDGVDWMDGRWRWRGIGGEFGWKWIDGREREGERSERARIRRPLSRALSYSLTPCRLDLSLSLSLRLKR